jgi:diacylglycerol kinase
MKNQNILEGIKIAFHGIWWAFKEESNFRIQVLAGLLAIILTFAFRVTEIEKCIVVLTVAAVLSLELINSQIEKFLDIIQPELHHRVKRIKDFSAGAVLIAALGSVAVGLIIFAPYFLKYL